jgi:hypothetical protein
MAIWAMLSTEGVKARIDAIVHDLQAIQQRTAEEEVIRPPFIRVLRKRRLSRSAVVGATLA